MTNRPETSGDLENQRLRSLPTPAYELRRVGDECYALYHRPLLTQGVACPEQHPHPATPNDPSAFVHAVTVGPDQWLVIAEWLEREVREGGPSDTAARLWGNWGALRLIAPWGSACIN